jgi:hypothetical protein
MHVADVLKLASQKQVVGVAAGPVVAVVADEAAPRHNAVEELVREAMHVVDDVAPAQRAVALARRALPDPATALITRQRLEDRANLLCGATPRWYPLSLPRIGPAHQDLRI